MTAISDVFAFAAQNADYWTEFLSESNYPAELTEEEVRGLSAARMHVDEQVVELLHSCAAQLADRLGPARFARPRPQPGATAKNRKVRLPVPSGLGEKLYGIEFSLDRNPSGRAVELFASLVVKKAALVALRQVLGEGHVEHYVDDYHVYAQGLAINIGDDMTGLAARSAQQVVDMLAGFGNY